MSLNDTPEEDHTHQHNLARVESAVQDHVLGCISTCQLGALRRTCRAWRDLIDASPIAPLLPAAEQLVPAAILPALNTSLDLQAALCQQSLVLRNMHAGSMRLQALLRSPASLENCTGWSQWSPSYGHRWLTGPACRPGQDPHRYNGRAFRHHALLNTITLQQEQLPAQPIGGRCIGAAWTTWVGTGRDHVLMCLADSSLQVFKPGTNISYNLMHKDVPLLTSQMSPTDLLAPAASALLWPRIVSGHYQVFKLDLPYLTESHCAPWIGPGSGPEDRSPEWIAWSPRGDLYSMAWMPSSKETAAANSLELHIHAAADGRCHGRISLPWGRHRHHSQYRWMKRGDCIVILLHCMPTSPNQLPLELPPTYRNEVANVISSTGQLLQVMRCDAWHRTVACSPDGEFMHMYGSDPDGHLAGLNIFSLTHLRSRKVVSGELADRGSAFGRTNIWSRDSRWCSHLSATRRCIVQLHGMDFASEARCCLPEDLGMEWRDIPDVNLSFSPFRQLLVEAVNVKHTPRSWQLVHWDCCQAGMPATFNAVSTSPTGPHSSDLNVGDLAWHPSPLLQAYIVCEGHQPGHQRLHLVCSRKHMLQTSRKHVLLRSWLIKDLLTHLGVLTLADSGSLVWSPDGTKLFIACHRNAGAFIMDFGEDPSLGTA